ncbi:hypothetical protein [Oryzobacter terrae]|uniref:hypothetical protein n=1 Tax=Oryzobacter terrae TaxID=1620385 RepID=UPI00366C013A
MTPATDERTAPDTASGAVLFHPPSPLHEVALTEREFWRAVGATVLATLRPWSR